MPLIIELTLTKDRNNLNNVFKGIIVNSEEKTVNKAAQEIIKNDMVKYKPRHLIHCYSLKELTKILELFRKQGYSTEISREIIPNNYNLGIIREVYIKEEGLENSKMFSKKYRYYIFMTKDDQSLALTYNPQISDLQSVKQAKILVGENEVAHCQILQTVTAQRDIKIEKEVKDTLGTYTIYQI